MKFMKKLSLLVLALLFLVGCQAKPAADGTDSAADAVREWFTAEEPVYYRHETEESRTGYPAFLSKFVVTGGRFHEKSAHRRFSFHHRKHLGAGDGPGGREQSGIKLVNTAGKTFDHRPGNGTNGTFPGGSFPGGGFSGDLRHFHSAGGAVEKREIKPPAAYCAWLWFSLTFSCNLL